MDVRVLSCSRLGEVLIMLHSVEQTVSNFWTYWTNDTCPLITNASASCTRGYYAKYVIMAKTKDHIKAGVDFARDKNVRLVIRNTGHDFMGRSTGYGALVINTHSFKDVTFVKEVLGTWGLEGGSGHCRCGDPGTGVVSPSQCAEPTGGGGWWRMPGTLSTSQAIHPRQF
jgi:hypothetical protein